MDWKKRTFCRPPMIWGVIAEDWMTRMTKTRKLKREAGRWWEEGEGWWERVEPWGTMSMGEETRRGGGGAERSGGG